MEPTQATIIFNYIIYSSVVDVAKMDKIVGGYKEGDQTMIVKEDQGWFVLFEGSQERMYFGEEEPTLKKGDEVKITIEKIK